MTEHLWNKKAYGNQEWKLKCKRISVRSKVQISKFVNEHGGSIDKLHYKLGVMILNAKTNDQMGFTLSISISLTQ